ncbi:MAG: hypothetical protein BroJett022_12120 [Actinomycetes bacterium]|nr:MAG: hypothetical protein BroJett022_12120 [Actinomycetes bacterium]
MSAPGRGAGWRTVLVLTLVGAAAGFAWGIADRPVYRAAATVAVESDSEGADRARLERFAQRGESAAVARRAAAILGRDVPGADLLADVSVEPGPAGGFLVVGAESAAPDVAAAAADGYARALVATEGDPLALGAAPAVPGEPLTDRPAGPWAGIGAVAGLLAGLLAVAATRREPPRGSRQGAAARRPAAGDGIVDFDFGLLGDAGSGALAIAPAAVADAGMLADRLGVRSGAGARSLAVVPVNALAPAVEVAATLAIAAAGAGRRALVVESDLDGPTLADRLGVEPSPGLAEYMAGDAAPRDVLRAVAAQPAGFACVPAGNGSAGGLPGPRFADLAARLARAYDLVAHVTPPIDGGGGEAVAALFDDVVVVAGPAGGGAELGRAAARLGGDQVRALVRARP